MKRPTRSRSRELKVFFTSSPPSPPRRLSRCPVRPIKLIEREGRELFELSQIVSRGDFQLDQIVSRELSEGREEAPMSPPERLAR